jgi:hypothetical protein
MSTITAPAPRVNARSRPLTVELTLTINGQAYHVEPIAHAPGGAKSYRLAKHSGDGATYDLDAFADRVECSCPSYTKTHEGTSSLCKHGRALVMVGLVDYPDETAADARAAYDSAREKLAAIAETEDAVRREGENQADVRSLNSHARVAPAFDADFYRAQNAVAERRALWLSHRHLHTSDPLPAPKAAAEPEPACCPDDEPMPCRACVAHEGPGDMADGGWMDDARWELGPDDDAPFASWLDEQAEAFATIGSPRASWLAGRIARLAEQARFLDAATPEAFDDRLDCMLDAEAARIEARHAASCC